MLKKAMLFLLFAPNLSFGYAQTLDSTAIQKPSPLYYGHAFRSFGIIGGGYFAAVLGNSFFPMIRVAKPLAIGLDLGDYFMLSNTDEYINGNSFGFRLEIAPSSSKPKFQNFRVDYCLGWNYEVFHFKTLSQDGGNGKTYTHQKGIQRNLYAGVMPSILLNKKSQHLYIYYRGEMGLQYTWGSNGNTGNVDQLLRVIPLGVSFELKK